jgi:hypothetical protein
MNCLNPDCRNPVPPSARLCPTCSWDNGCPNVRQAQVEKTALQRRLRLAEADAQKRSCLGQLKMFRDQLRKSVAVIATSANKAHALLNDSSEAYTTFYRVVQSGARIPRDNWFDQVRGVADELLFPNYRDYISFAALSLDGRGCWYYGSVHLVLADFAIRERATAFEQNSLLFCQEHQLGVHDAVPPGYRAVWPQRDQLAAAKLVPALHSAISLEELPAVLLNRPDEVDAEFIEIHIFDRLNRGSIQRVVVRPGGTEDDEIMKQLVLRDCRRIGIPFEQIQ